MSKVLVTGGAGYIGTHILCVLDSVGRQSLCIDNYVNSSPKSLARVDEIVPGEVETIELDIRDVEGLRRLLSTHQVDSVIHLAGLKAVGESVEQPERYRDNNVEGTRVLLEALREGADNPGPKSFVFSSSATDYGTPRKVPIDESQPT